MSSFCWKKKRESLGQFVYSGCSKLYKINEEIKNKKRTFNAIHKADCIKKGFKKPLEKLPYMADKDKDRYPKYWYILEMILGVIHYLGKQYIAFRGLCEEINSDKNSVKTDKFVYLLLKLQAVFLFIYLFLFNTLFTVE